MLNVFQGLLDANKKEINRLQKIVAEVNAYEKGVKKLTDKQLLTFSNQLKERFSQGDSLDKLLPEAFAIVREVADRVNNTRPFDVQLMSAASLHNGKISEQKTGEGKTLSAVPAIYLNALSGRGVHVITVNDYLARRDCGWNGPIFAALGMTCATIIHEQAFLYDPEYKAPKVDDDRLIHLRPISRKEAYAADITYGTNNEFGFDYLRDNMATSLEHQVQRGHYFAIVDEVDSILIDEARTPLIISAPANEPTQKYVKFSKIIDSLQPDDFVVDEKLRTSHLTDGAIVKIEKILGVDNLYENDFSTLHHLEEALKARTLFQKDRDYVVRDGEVIIVDEFTGRLMPGRRYSEGLHQAIEAKEGVTIQQESKTMATISFQNYFRMYEKLAGMTGTAATEAEEFYKIYKLEVVVIPTHRPMLRKDHADSIYKTQAAKYNAVAEEIAKIHESGQPVLVGTTSIEKNEFLSDLLKRKKISHALLNAKNHEREAEIIADAGQKGAVTVATNLAGRGVDIKLGEGVDKLGGLYVIGTERHESRRIDNQLRGRSGRQGDPGASKFFVSLEDDLMRIFGGEQVAKMMNFLKVPEDMPIENPLVSRALEGAQKKVEGHNFDIRKHTVEYDDVMNQQRKIIYGVRQQILELVAKKGESGEGLKGEILDKVKKEIQAIVMVNSQDSVDLEKIIDQFSLIVPFDDNSKQQILAQIKQIDDATKIEEFLIKLADDLYEQKEKQVGAEGTRLIETMIYLQTMDELWVEHLDTVDDLRSGINLRAYAQRDPLVEYKKEAFDLFDKLMQNIDSHIVHRIYKVSVPNAQPIQVAPVIQEQHEEALDLDQFVADLESEIETNPDAKVKIERPDDNTPVVNRSTEELAPAIKVMIERPGQEPIKQVLSESGNAVSAHPKLGRNDECWCGSGKKYKKCHYPN